MQRTSASYPPPIALDSKSKTPLYRQLYEWFRQAIVDGQMRPGQRVPSTRNLAEELKVSRIPVLGAYEQLHAEGYLETFVGAGTCVARSIPDDALKPAAGKVRTAMRRISQGKAPRRISRRLASMRMLPQPWLSNPGAFRVSLPALDQFPMAAWSALVSRHSRNHSSQMMVYGDPMGYAPFREAIAEYLGASRAVRCDPSQIMIVAGSQIGLQISARALLDPRDHAWVEEPGYPGAHQALRSAGADLVPVPIDREGLNVEEGVRRSRNARAVYITPSHQYPVGVTMSATRRMQLLNWAARTGAWIIEDDYDSEYRFGSRPIASLQGLDTDARVIYIGTLSKVLFPALRVGYVVVPKDLIGAFCAEGPDTSSSALLQAALTDFIKEGHFARHIRRMRMLYMDRRATLIEAIRTHMGDSLEVVSAEAGIHLVVLLPRGTNDRAVSQKAADIGISATPLSTCYLKRSSRGGLILGFGNTSTEQIQDGVRRLAKVLRDVTAP